MKNFFLSATTATAVLFGAAAAYANEEVTYLFPGPDFLPAFSPFQLALGKGYYNEEGLDVTFRIGNGGADVATQVAVGNADMGGGMGDTPIIVRANGLKIRGVALLGGQGLTQFVWRKDSGITSVSDFEGHEIGVAGFQSTEFYNLRAALALSDVNVDDVDIQALGYGGIMPGMISGAVSGMSGVPEWIVAIEDAGVELEIVPARDIFPAQAQAILASDKFIEEHPDAVRAFTSATLRAIDDIIADPHQAALDYVGFVEQHAENVEQVERIMRMYADLVYEQDGDRPIGAFDPEELKKVQDAYLDNDFVSGAVPIGDLYTNEFVID